MTGKALVFLCMIVVFSGCNVLAERDRRIAQHNAIAKRLKEKGLRMGRSLGLEGMSCSHRWNLPRVGGGVRCSGLRGASVVDIICTYDGACVVSAPNTVNVSASAEASLL